ncbi:minor capsid protein [[Clostridium] innocuum]|nr:minor capsid protein [[Clostridium] innocuum]MCR0575875.1 minor capsid protein [[Clostridium] innocuum]
MEEKDVKYWERRKAQRMWEHMQSAEEAADQISKVYRKSSGYINHQIDTIYNRFKSKHHLSDAEARRLINKMQNKLSLDELRNLLKQETDSDEKKELLKLIESPAYAARMARLQEVQSEIDQMMKSTYQIEKDRSTRHYTNLAQDSYYKSIYDIQRDTGLAFSFAGISAEQIDKVLKSKWSGANYSQRIWHNTQKLADDLKEELLINLMTGRTNREVAEIIQNKFQSGAMEARRLVRTESCYIANEMEGQSYEECGIAKYIFVATLDKKTSETCRALDRKVFNIKDRAPGRNCPPMHPWCRSTTVAYLNDKTLSSLTRRARDPETGETYKVPANMSYPEWYEKYVSNDSKKTNAVKAHRNRHADHEQYEKYKTAFRDDKAFESFDKFQRMKYNDGETYKSLVSKYKQKNQRDWEQNTISKGASVNGFLSMKSPDDAPQWMHDQINKWTIEECEALNYYTSNNFRKINEYLRGKSEATPELLNRINNVKSAIKKSDIEQNIIVWRGTSFSNLVDGGLLKDTPLTDWPGLILNDKAFSSTSIIQGSAFNNELNLEILLPKGVNGAYISSISEFESEYELLLENNAMLQILEAESRGGKYFVKALLRKSGD